MSHDMQLDRSAQDRGAELLADVRRVGAAAALRAAEIDDLGVFPADLFADLESTGVFRTLIPEAQGGLGLSLPIANEAIIEGARANGSLGWLLMIGVAGVLATGLPSEAAMKKVRDLRTDVRLRMVIAPRGTATPVDGGYLVTGQWPFCSGGPNPDFLLGNCFKLVDGQMSFSADGIPAMIAAFMPAGDIEPVDNWHVLGMRGTNSCDYIAKDLFVPEDMCVDVFTAKSNFDTPAARIPGRVSASTGHAAVAVGIAQGALDEIAELSKSKRPALKPMTLLSDSPLFQYQLGEQTLRLMSMRALYDQINADVWQRGAEGRDASPREIFASRSMAGFITAECAKVVDWAYTAAGGTPVYNSSSLQRRMRDIHTASQHAMVSLEGYTLLGAAVLDKEFSSMELRF